MYDRAARDVTFKVGCTTEDIGPGSYDTGMKFKCKGDGYAPFLSMSSRETHQHINDQVVATPGPAHYDIGLHQDGPKGRGPLANKSKRFSDPAHDTPGPGSYIPHKYLELGRKAKSAPGVGGKNQGLVTNRVKFYRKPEAPSIPSQGQAYGYEECDDGTLKKQSIPHRDVSGGPAYYSPAVPDSQSTEMYKGIHFGKMTSRRMGFFGKLGPGPADYDPHLGREYPVLNTNIQGEEHFRYESRLPRYHEIVQLDEEKKAFPGPGTYEFKSTFQRQVPALNTDGIEIEHPPFLSQSKRFAPTKTTTPAPGTYNNPVTALGVLYRVTGLKRSPFSQTSVRFNPENPVKRTPGPGAYNIPGLGAESMRKAYMEATRKGVFGTTSSRSQATKANEADLPGPAHYQVPEKTFQPRYPTLGPNFASVTKRLKVPELEVPPPGSYDIAGAYEKSQVRPSRAKPRSDAASRKHNSFMSAAARFTYITDDTPGPASYNTATETLNAKGGQVMSKDKRFHELKEDYPGPGTYELSPLLQDTVLKGTFNHTLGNPLVPAQDTTSQAATDTKHPFLLGV